MVAGTPPPGQGRFGLPVEAVNDPSDRQHQTRERRYRKVSEPPSSRSRPLAGSGTACSDTLSYQKEEPGLLMLMPRRTSSNESPAPAAFRFPVPTRLLSI